MAATDVRIELDLKVPMRDGVLLSADVYRPLSVERVPAVLCRTIYDNQEPRYVEWAYRFAQAGYAAVIQDCRGRYDSEGVWTPYLCEIEDGFDTQQWLGAKPWCDGQIGTFGISYLGFTQILPAPLRSPHTKALVPIANQEDNYGLIYCDGGALQLQTAMHFGWIGGRTCQTQSWQLVDRARLYARLPLLSALDVIDRPIYRTFLQHPTFDEYWKSYTLKGKYEQVQAPALFITGWYDNLVHEVFKTFRGWRHEAGTEAARAQTKLLVGPWTHTLIGSAEHFGDVDFGPGAAVDLPALHLRWYDQRLKGIDTGIDQEGPVRLFVMGANTWRTEQEWPLARTRYTRYYLHSRGRANSLFGDGVLSPTPPDDEPADIFWYDPRDPVPTLGGQSLLLEDSGPRDRRPVERRDDVLVYTTPPLAEDVEVTGPVSVTLYAESSAPDTDFTATLVDVHPNGKAIHLCEGIVRARFRDSLEHPAPIEPGQVYEYTLSLWETSNRFLAGHRIRLEVSSSNFPRFSRNLNTGEDQATSTRMEVAQQTVLHTGRFPSFVLLPIIPT